jgi:C_GCAxxG_C_C family probable redox protein
MDKTKKAIATFNNGKNCAQSVLGAYADDFKLDEEQMNKMALAFGGGMGHTNGICGAISGGLMVLGLKLNEHEFDKEKTYAGTRHLMDEFITRNGTRDCEKLIGVDLMTAEGKKQFKEEKIKQKVCEKCIADVIDIIENET